MDLQISRHVTTFSRQAPVASALAARLESADENGLEAFEELSMWRLVLAPHASRELHWQSGVAGKGYVAGGRGRLTVVDADGRIGSYLIGPGDSYFVPPAYRHHIENIGAATLNILISLDRANGVTRGPAAPDLSPQPIAADRNSSLLA